MRIFLLFLGIQFLIVFQSKAQSSQQGLKELSIDLSSINLGSGQEVSPATFGSLEVNLTIIDTVRKSGNYTLRKHTWIEKDEYYVLRTVPSAKILTFRGEGILSIADFDRVLVEKKTKNYNTYHLCDLCDSTNSITLNEVLQIENLDSQEIKYDENYKRNFKALKRIRRAKPFPNYSRKGPFLKVYGTKKELKQLLKDPILRNVKFEIREIQE